MSFWSSSVLVAVTAFLIMFLPSLLRETLPLHFGGEVADGFEEVKDVFRKNFETGKEPSGGGSAFSVYHKGKKVVDLWGGYADAESKRLWTEDTTSMFFSCTKTVAMVCVLRLVDQGLLDLDQTVASYWPEFAQNGKEDITLRVLFSHQAGLAVLNESISFEVMKDYNEIDRILATSPPLWEPGTDRGYHALSFGFYCAHLLRRVDPEHRPLSQFFREEIARPFGIDFGTNVPHHEYYRMSRLEPMVRSHVLQVAANLFADPNFLPMLLNLLDSSSLMWQALRQWNEVAEHHVYGDPYKAVLEFPSGLGTGTARGMAKLFGMLANGGMDDRGSRILSKELVGEMGKVHSQGKDRLLGLEVKFGLGTWFFDVDGHSTFGHPGAGGQATFSDPDYRLGYAYVSRMLSAMGVGNDPRYLLLREATYRCVKWLKERTP